MLHDKIVEYRTGSSPQLLSFIPDSKTAFMKKKLDKFLSITISVGALTVAIAPVAYGFDCSQLGSLATYDSRCQQTPSNPEVIRGTRLQAQGYWIHSGKKYEIKSVYVSYRESLNWLLIRVYPFELSEEEERQIVELRGINQVIGAKIEQMGEDFRSFGAIFNLKEGIVNPGFEHIERVSSLYSRGTEKGTVRNRTRSYASDRWSEHVKIEDFRVGSLKEGAKVDIAWKISDNDQKAEVRISAMIVD